MENISSITIDETLLTGAEGLTSIIDEKTLACSPAPIAASTVIREKCFSSRQRIPFDDGGSFVNNRSATLGQAEDDGSSDDRSSLGLLPSNYLLDVENDLLFQGNIYLSRNIPSADIPAVGHSSTNNSQKNQLLDSLSSREHTSDSHDFMTTVKKCPQAVDSARDGGRYAPQALFQNVAEVNESSLDNSMVPERDFREHNSEKWDTDEPQQNTDSGMGQTNFTNSQRSKCSEAATSGLGAQITNSAREENDTDVKLPIAQNQQDEADQTVHEVELEAEDLEELEESFTDFGDSSDEEGCDKLVPVGGDMKTHKLGTYTDVKEGSSKQSMHETNLSAVTCMDNVFKVPLPPSKPNKMHFGTPVFASTAIFCKDSEASQVFGDSMQFHQSELVSEWGPSIEFGSSTHTGDTLNLEKVLQSLDETAQDADDTLLFDVHDSKKGLGKTTGSISYAFGNFGKQNGSNFEQPSFGDLPSDDGGKLCQEFTQNLRNFGDLSLKTSSNKNQSNLQADNPFKDCSGEITFEGFRDEDFLLDADAAAAMLAEDEQKFRQDNLIGAEFNSTLGSVRGDDQTFMNMTIATYMAMGSGEHGSLTSHDKRPEFGMKVKSPSAERSFVPILSSDEIFSPPDKNGTKQASADKLECLKNSQIFLDSNTNASVTLEKGNLQNTLKHCNQEAGHMRKLSPMLDANAKKFIQNDSVKNSFRTEMHQMASKANLSSHSETSAQKILTTESKIGSTDEKYIHPSVTGSQQPLISENSTKGVDNDSLIQSYLLQTRQEDDTINSTSSEVTFSSIYKLIERSDISLVDPAQLIFSEYSKKVKEKQEAKLSKPRNNKMLYGKGQDDDLKSVETAAQFQANANTFRKETRIPKRKVDTSSNVQASTIQITKDTSNTEICMSQVQAEKCPVDTRLPTNLGMPKSEVRPYNNSQNVEVQHGKTNRDLSKHVTHFSQNNQGTHQTAELQYVRTSRDVAKPVTHISQNNQGTHQTAELQHVRTSRDVAKPVTRISKNNQDHQTAEVQTVQRDRNLSKSEIHLSEDKDNYEKTQAKKVADVALKTFKPVSQIENDCNSRRDPSQIMSGTKHASQSEFIFPNKYISTEKPGNQQRNLLKKTTSAHQTAKLEQTVISAVPEDSNLSLESVTINSQYSMTATSTTPTAAQLEHSLAKPSLLKEKIMQLSYAKPQRSMPSTPAHLHQLLNVTTDSSVQGDMSEVSQFHSLMLDNTNSVLQTTEMQDKFVSSTPLSAHRPGIQKFTNITQMCEKSILPVLTPKTAINILNLPEVVHVPEVCCVNLSQQTSFSIINLLDRGVKCLLTIREVIFKNQRLRGNFLPFELKRQVILSPSASQNVQVIFRPKSDGEYIAVVEVFSQNMTNPQENRTYIVHVSGCAEPPLLKMSPSSGEIDFGDLLWGSTSCRFVKIKNVGRATIPLRFSIIRKESALCNFSFYPENQSDVSAISLTTRPAAAGSVYSMSLPGMKEREIITETVKIYCHAKELQKFPEKAEKFHAQLLLSLDMPIEDTPPLEAVKLHVTVGMYKLHVDKDSLFISVPPGNTGQDSFYIINSGNIPMPVDIIFEPPRDQFSLSTDHVVVPGGDKCPIYVTFTPQPTREGQDDNKVNILLQNQVFQSLISVIGETASTKINSSSAAVNFGGVNLGQSSQEKLTFKADNDDDIKVWIKNPGSAFKLLREDGAFVETLEMSVEKEKQYTLHLLFSPSEIIGYRADLSLQILYSNRYIIPISGYGRCSKLLIEKVYESQTGGRWLDIGCLTPGTSAIHKITVKNVGVRCCFIKASFGDASSQEFHPSRGRVVPSTLILSPNETTDLLLVLDPSQKEADLCKFSRAIVGIIKLTSSDEIMRQQFLSSKPDKKSKKKIKHFDIPLTSVQREIVDAELKGVSAHALSYSTFMKSMTVIKIAVFGNPSEKLPASPLSMTSRLEAEVSRLSPQQRPALKPVSPNIKPTERRKDDWMLTPSEIRLSDSKVKEFVQIINFSRNELQFSIQCDEGITVTPSIASVKPKNTTMLVVQGDLAYFSRKEPAARSALVSVQCVQKVKYIRVFVEITPDKMSPKPSLPSLRDKPSSIPITSELPLNYSTQSTSSVQSQELSRPLCGSVVDHAVHRSALSTDDKEAGRMKIQGSNMIIFPTTEAGIKRDQTYFFTNLCTQPLTWELAPFAPPYVKHADNTQNLYRVSYDVFKLSPLTGVLQPDETEKVSIEFHPQSKGSFNQTWCIHDTADGQSSSHRFALYAKASPSTSFARNPAEIIVPQGLSPTHVSTSPRGRLPGHIAESQSLSKEPTSKTAQSSSTKHKFTTKLNPGASWSSVSESDTEMLHPLVSGNQMTLNKPSSGHFPGETNVPHNTSEAENSSAALLSSLSLSSQQPNLVGDNSLRSEKESEAGFHLLEDLIEFPKLRPGETAVRKLHLRNTSPEDIQIVVEHVPKPPFKIKHHSFSVRNNKMIMFPVTFKPRHVDKFKDKVIFRNTETGNTFTAFLEAECLN